MRHEIQCIRKDVHRNLVCTTQLLLQNLRVEPLILTVALLLRDAVLNGLEDVSKELWRHVGAGAAVQAKATLSGRVANATLSGRVANAMWAAMVKAGRR